MLEGSKNICINFFKEMTTLCPKAKFSFGKRKTTQFHVDINKSNISIPKTITWSEITLPSFWTLAVTPKIRLRKGNSIIKNLVGYVKVIFENFTIRKKNF